jgi:hypothetical protein
MIVVAAAEPGAGRFSGALEEAAAMLLTPPADLRRGRQGPSRFPRAGLRSSLGPAEPSR